MAEPAAPPKEPDGGLRTDVVGVDRNGDIWFCQPDGSWLQVGSLPKPKVQQEE